MIDNLLDIMSAWPTITWCWIMFGIYAIAQVILISYTAWKVFTID